ncbi:MAG TPA: 16S rRNA (adenine(1518)-N(6)/adenine(1519)-N(6))-dimethyltransferase RsmA [Candidatus Paceibacterota bacterium]
MFQKKSLGQNFLKNPGIISDIVAASKVSPDDIVLEIGPGQGILTRELLIKTKKVIAVEKDDRLISYLQERFHSEIQAGKFEIMHADILDFDLDSALGDKPYKIVANIPYYITGQVIRKFLETNNQPVSMTLLLQKEVAERLVAKDGKESLLSISVKVYGKPKYVRTVARGNFRPIPKVDSAILSVENITKSLFSDVDRDKFFEILKKGFAHKRKLLASNLEIPKAKRSFFFKAIDINEQTRPEDLTVVEWKKVVSHL